MLAAPCLFPAQSTELNHAALLFPCPQALRQVITSPLIASCSLLDHLALSQPLVSPLGGGVSAIFLKEMFLCLLLVHGLPDKNWAELQFSMGLICWLLHIPKIEDCVWVMIEPHQSHTRAWVHPSLYSVPDGWAAPLIQCRRLLPIRSLPCAESLCPIC